MQARTHLVLEHLFVDPEVGVRVEVVVLAARVEGAKIPKRPGGVEAGYGILNTFAAYALDYCCREILYK